MKVVASWSGGKDACLAMHRARSDGHDIVCLLNFISREFGRCCFHGIEAELMKRQAECLGIEMVQHAVSPDMDRYEQEFKAAVTSLRESRGVEGMVFGDIYLDEHREWVERVCSDLAIKPVEPLWHREPAELVDEFVGLGYRAVVTSARHDMFDESFVGSAVDSDMKRYLVSRRICPCGENGEFHTFVYDGPVFGKRIDITESGKISRDGFWKHWYLDIRKYEIVEKG